MVRQYARLAIQFLVVAALVCGGWWIRTLPPGGLARGVEAWWPWPGSQVVTLYFTDGTYLVPVSRRLPAIGDVPRAALQSLLDGPAEGTGLIAGVPDDLEIRSLNLVDEVLHIDLSAAVLDEDGVGDQARASIVTTMTALPGVTGVMLSADGRLLESASRTPLLYFASAGGLVAVPVPAPTARDAIAVYMTGAPDPLLTGLPRDVRLLDYLYEPGAGLASLRFSYTPSLRDLAIERPDVMRTVLLGLIASLTEFPDVRAVRLDFDGQARLGLGQCSDLLGTPQPRPRVLNDERLLGRT
jgi:spore germination protein GerM